MPPAAGWRQESVRGRLLTGSHETVDAKPPRCGRARRGQLGEISLVRPRCRAVPDLAGAARDVDADARSSFPRRRAARRFVGSCVPASAQTGRVELERQRQPVAHGAGRWSPTPRERRCIAGAFFPGRCLHASPPTEKRNSLSSIQEPRAAFCLRLRPVSRRPRGNAGCGGIAVTQLGPGPARPVVEVSRDLEGCGHV